jgi:acetylornithine deacetylase
VVVLGPGDMRTAHSERECVAGEELERWTKAIEQLLAKGSAERQLPASSF